MSSSSPRASAIWISRRCTSTSSAFRDVTVNGAPYRVLTVSFQSGGAVQIARSKDRAALPPPPAVTDNRLS